MKFDELKTVVVIGAGAMGRQIAMNTVLNGRAVEFFFNQGLQAVP